MLFKKFLVSLLLLTPISTVSAMTDAEWRQRQDEIHQQQLEEDRRKDQQRQEDIRQQQLQDDRLKEQRRQDDLRRQRLEDDRRRQRRV